ncbi:sterol carrier family protein [Galbitalea sp. SE-J8]|uniref:sterol carrier family protein n=1 Tax=Galbitalea sp. SE-J8 TaxID=3054952 RepID=UPI00259CF508|nr:sterol carrier family protein [Galbitalea sp. SE-J8]MDM4762239.1 sterol carrier family protein [Galbitalea sp. SE-J8]
MARARIPDVDGRDAVVAALGAHAAGTSAPRDTTAMAVRYTLQLLGELHRGNSVEVRVPPYGAVQAIEGPRHTRGTPPNVVETDAATWLALATGGLDWDAALAGGTVAASGTRADLGSFVPVMQASR